MTILIKNVTLVPMDSRDKILSNMNVLIENNLIKDIFSGEKEVLADKIISGEKEVLADKIISGENKLLMPGLINAHTHVGMTIFRNYADDLPLYEWLNDAIWPLEAKLTGDDVYWASALGIVEMIQSGTTTFSDMYFFMDQVAQAVGELGIRAVLARGLSDDQDPIKNQAKLDEVRKMYQDWNHAYDNRINLLIGPHAPYTCGSKFLKDCVSLAQELETGIHIHLSETKKEVEDSYDAHDLSPIAYANKIGIFNLPTLAAHCAVLSNEDIEILREKNVYPVNNPGSNLKLASGFARVDDILAKGIPMALGTDSASSNNSLDMFEEINLAALINKAINQDATSVSAYQALEMATINGAKALGLQDEIGSIEIGKKADMILLDLNNSHFFPRNNLISALAYSAKGSDVDTVIVDGKILMEDKKLVDIDVDKIFDQAQRVIGEIEKR